MDTAPSCSVYCNVLIFLFYGCVSKSPLLECMHRQKLVSTLAIEEQHFCTNHTYQQTAHSIYNSKVVSLLYFL